MSAFLKKSGSVGNLRVLVYKIRELITYCKDIFADKSELFDLIFSPIRSEG